MRRWEVSGSDKSHSQLACGSDGSSSCGDDPSSVARRPTAGAVRPDNNSGHAPGAETTQVNHVRLAQKLSRGVQARLSALPPGLVDGLGHGDPGHVHVRLMDEGPITARQSLLCQRRGHCPVDVTVCELGFDARNLASTCLISTQGRRLARPSACSRATTVAATRRQQIEVQTPSGGGGCRQVHFEHGLAARRQDIASASSAADQAPRHSRGMPCWCRAGQPHYRPSVT